MNAGLDMIIRIIADEFAYYTPGENGGFFTNMIYSGLNWSVIIKVHSKYDDKFTKLNVGR